MSEFGPPAKVFAGITGCSSFSLLTTAGTIHRCNCLAFKTTHMKGCNLQTECCIEEQKRYKKDDFAPKGSPVFFLHHQSSGPPPEAWKLEGSAQFLRCSKDSCVQVSGSRPPSASTLPQGPLLLSFSTSSPSPASLLWMLLSLGISKSVIAAVHLMILTTTVSG